jgi:hypothetical protein
MEGVLRTCGLLYNIRERIPVHSSLCLPAHLNVSREHSLARTIQINFYSALYELCACLSEQNCMDLCKNPSERRRRRHLSLCINHTGDNMRARSPHVFKAEESQKRTGIYFGSQHDSRLYRRDLKVLK